MEEYRYVCYAWYDPGSARAPQGRRAEDGYLIELVHILTLVEKNLAVAVVDDGTLDDRGRDDVLDLLRYHNCFAEELTTGRSTVRAREGPPYRGIAQQVEQRSPKPRAEGSIPSAPANTNYGFFRFRYKK